MVVLSCTFPALAQQKNQGKILGAYFEQWSIYYPGYGLANLESNGSAARISHLIYAYANVTSPTPEGSSCVIADPMADFEATNLVPVGGIPDTAPLFGNFAEIQKLKQLHPNLKTLIAIGGGSAKNTAAFSAAASTEAGRHALAASCIDMFIVGNVGSNANGPVTAPGLFDGFNIAWKYPTAADKQNFTLLLQEFRNQLNALSATTGKTYTLTFAGPARSQNYQNIDLGKAAEVADFITINGYDYAGSGNAQTNHSSSLFDSPFNPTVGQGLDIDSTVNAYLAAGVPPQKYTMGVPLYGVGWTGVPSPGNGLYQSAVGPVPVPLANGTGLCTDPSGNMPGCDTLLTPGVATYATLSTLTGNGYTSNYDPLRVAAWLYDEHSKTFYSYDNPFTATLKMLYVDTKVPGGLGGAYVWAVKDDDANGTMVKTMATWLGR
jgi:chitinase